MSDTANKSSKIRNFFLMPLLALAIAVPVASTANVSDAEARSKRAAIIAGAIIGGAIGYHAYKRHKKYHRHYRKRAYHAPRYYKKRHYRKHHRVYRKHRIYRHHRVYKRHHGYGHYHHRPLRAHH